MEYGAVEMTVTLLEPPRGPTGTRGTKGTRGARGGGGKVQGTTVSMLSMCLPIGSTKGCTVLSVGKPVTAKRTGFSLVVAHILVVAQT